MISRSSRAFLTAFVLVSALVAPCGAGAVALGLDEDLCGPLPEPKVLLLPGLEGLPERLELSGGEVEKGLDRVLWMTPEPEGGVVAGDPATEAFLRTFALVTLWSHVEASALPAVRTPLWAKRFGFPVEETRTVDGLGEVALTVHFDAHPDVPSDHIEPWIEADYALDGRAYQLFTRGLGVDTTLGLVAGTKPEKTRLERRPKPKLSESSEMIVSAVMELTLGEALAVLAEEGYCVLEVRGVDGLAAPLVDGAPVRGVEVEGPRHLVLVVD